MLDYGVYSSVLKGQSEYASLSFKHALIYAKETENILKHTLSILRLFWSNHSANASEFILKIP